MVIFILRLFMVKLVKISGLIFIRSMSIMVELYVWGGIFTSRFDVLAILPTP